MLNVKMFRILLVSLSVLLGATSLYATGSVTGSEINGKQIAWHGGSHHGWHHGGHHRSWHNRGGHRGWHHGGHRHRGHHHGGHHRR